MKKHEQAQVFNPWRVAKNNKNIKKSKADTVKKSNYATHWRNNFFVLYGKADFEGLGLILKILMGPYLASADALRRGGLTALKIKNNQSHVGLLDYPLAPLVMLSLASIALHNAMDSAKLEKTNKLGLVLFSMAYYAFNIFVRFPLAIVATLTTVFFNIIKAAVAVVGATIGAFATLASEKISEHKATSAVKI